MSNRAANLVMRMSLPFIWTAIAVVALVKYADWMYGGLALVVGIYASVWWGWRSIVREITKDLEQKLQTAMEYTGDGFDGEDDN